MPVAGHTTGFHLITENGGIFPHGLFSALMLLQGVVFAYSGIELLGTAAGECEDAREILPRAINSVIWRIALFYVGSVILLVCLLPWTEYHAGTSPFVTFFQALGIPGIGTIMNIVVLTAALSSLNSGLYSTGRVLRALSLGGSGPKALGKLNRSSVPYVGILTTLAVYLVGVMLNYLIPSRVFEIVLNFSALGIISTWGFILLCQLRLRAAINRGDIAPTGFNMPGAPYTTWATLGFLGFVLIMMAFDYPDGTITIGAIPLIGAILIGGWCLLDRGRRHG
ncbi:MAG: amino acid permease, partial [Gluconobacter potus]